MKKKSVHPVQIG